MIRTGTCNRCGQCCGADDERPQHLKWPPWPDTWPDDVRTWSINDINEYIPIFRLTGHPELGGGQYGDNRCGNETCRWVWGMEGGLFKNESPWGDRANRNIAECPYLSVDNAASSRPCALEGSEHQAVFDVMCTPDKYPPLEMSEDQVLTWLTYYPRCSYVWVPGELAARMPKAPMFRRLPPLIRWPK